MSISHAIAANAFYWILSLSKETLESLEFSQPGMIIDVHKIKLTSKSLIQKHYCISGDGWGLFFVNYSGVFID